MPVKFVIKKREKGEKQFNGIGEQSIPLQSDEIHWQMKEALEAYAVSLCEKFGFNEVEFNALTFTATTYYDAKEGK